MTVKPTTELAAVNRLLQAIGESPVSSLTGDVGVDVVTARNTLNDVCIDVQGPGWQFNTEYDYPLLRDSEGHITVPADAASVDVQKGRFGETDPVLRGRRIYDRKNHTYVFKQNLKARIVFLLPFEELPQTARTYVTIRAARVFQDDSVGSETLHSFDERDEWSAKAVFENEEAVDEDLNFLRGDPLFGPTL